MFLQNRGGRGGPRGGGRDFGDRGGPPRGGPRDGGFGGSRGPGGPGEETAVMRVPSERCGIVIGKGRNERGSIAVGFGGLGWTGLRYKALCGALMLSCEFLGILTRS